MEGVKKKKKGKETKEMKYGSGRKGGQGEGVKIKRTDEENKRTQV